MPENFSLSAKNEIALIKNHNWSQETAFLSGIINSAGSIILSGKMLSVGIELTHAEVYEVVLKIITKKYKDAEVVKNARHLLIKDNLSAKRLLADSGVMEFSSDFFKLNEGLKPALVEKNPNAVCYLRGAFLGSGSVTVKKGYHLEFSSNRQKVAEDLSDLLLKFDLKSGVIERKEKFITYIKGAENVSDALALMGATKSVLKLNNTFVERQISRDTNRALNCDIANIDKTLKASESQLDAINILIESGGIDSLNEKLYETAMLRLQYPDISIENIAENLGITKSGAKHRLDKIVLTAEKFKN